MRILYLSQYFPPEIGATQTRAYEMARRLVQRGHSVTMLAEIPNHPSGVIPPAYRGKLFERRPLEGIDVIRVWVLASPRKTTFTRLAFYLTYMINAFLAGLLIAPGGYDLVYASSPPLFVALAGWALSRTLRIPFFFEVRDLWPAVAASLGELRSPKLLRLAERTELFLYRQAREIVVVTQGFQQNLIARCVSPEKIHLIPNGTDPELFHPSRTNHLLRSQLGLEGRFVIGYTGLHGIAQGLETVLDAADHLRSKPDIAFLFVGGGPAREQLLAFSRALKLGNVVFHPEVPRDQIAHYMNACDVLLAPLKADAIFASFIPSKIFDYMACEKPVLLCVPGEARQVIEEAGAGWFVPPGDPMALAEAVLRLRDLTAEERQSMGRRGRQYVLDKFARAAQADELERLLFASLSKQSLRGFP